MGASRFVTYKHLDRVLDFAKETGREVVLAGRGPDEQSLRAYAAQQGVRAHFVISPSNSLMRAVVQEADAFVSADRGLRDHGGRGRRPRHPGHRQPPRRRKEVVAPDRGAASAADCLKPDRWIGALEAVVDIDMACAVVRSRTFDNHSFGHQVRKWMDSEG